MVGRVTPVRAEIVWTDGVQRTARPTARFNLSMLNELRAVQFGQLTPDLLLAFGYFFGDIDLNNDIEIAALTRHARQSAFTQTKPLPTLSACRNFQSDIAFQSRHDQFTAQHRAPRLDFHVVNQIAAFDCKIRVPRQTHAKEKIAAF